MSSIKNTPPCPIDSLKLIPIADRFMQEWLDSQSQPLEEARIKAVNKPGSRDDGSLGVKTFLLTIKDDPSQPTLAGCDYYERPAMVATKKTAKCQDSTTASSVETRVQDTRVATIDTMLPCNGYGYDASMLSLLWQHLEKSSVPLTIMYSDSTLCEEYGWKNTQRDQIEIETDNQAPWASSPTTKASSGTECPAWEPITDANLGEILDRQTSLLRDELTLQIEDCPNDTTLVVLTDDQHLVRMLRRRENWFFGRSNRSTDLVSPPSADRYGVFLSAQCSPSGSSLNTLRYILWIHEFRHDQLLILNFRHGLDRSDLEAQREALLLLQQAVEEARRWQLSKVTIQNPHPTLCAWTGLPPQENSSRLVSLGVCHGPNVPEQDVFPTSHILLV